MSKSAPDPKSLSLPTSLALIAQHVRAGNRSMARLELDVQMSADGDQSAAWLWEAWLAESPAAARLALRKAYELQHDDKVVVAGLAFVQGLLDWRPADIETEFDIDPEFFVDSSRDRQAHDADTDFDIDPELLLQPVDQGPLELLELAEAALEIAASESGDERHPKPFAASHADEVDHETPRPPILVVDDSRTIRELVCFTLSRAGYDVTTASDGAEALREITLRRPALVLSDTIMPKLDGYQLCRLIRQHETANDIPVVLLSESDSVVEKLRRFSVGCTDHLAKPFESQSLIEIVRKRADCRTSEQTVDH